MFRGLNALCAAIAALALGSPSYAAVIRVTASGLVENGADDAGIFAATGTDLTGQAFQAPFNIDTSKGYVTGGVVYGQAFPGGPPEFFEYDSVLHNSGAVPAVTGALDIDGKSYSVDGSKFGENSYVTVRDDGGHDSLIQDVASSNAELLLYDGFDPIYPASPLVTGDGVFYDPNLYPHSFSIDYSTIPGLYFPASFNFGSGASSTDLQLDGVQVSYTVISAGGGPTSFVSSAPEPLAWILMVVGVGMVGTTIRATKKGRQGLVSDPA